MQATDNAIFRIMPFWIGYGFLGLLFYLGRDADTKRRLWPLYNIGGGLCFLWFLTHFHFPPAGLALAALFLVFAVWQNSRSTRFCDGCGRMYRRDTSEGAPAFCSKCGAKLGQKDQDN